MLMRHDFPLTDDQRAGNPRAASIRLETRNASRLYGQRRHDLRSGPQPLYVDDARSRLNRIIVPYPRVCEVRDLCLECRANRATVRAMSKSHAIAMTGIITFGRDAARMFELLTPAAQDAAFLDLAEATAERLNTTVSGLVVHRDETTIHAHFELIGYTHHGRPLSKATRPGIMSSLQDLTAEVMGHHCPGIERGRRYGECLAAGAEFRDILRSVKRLHQDLPHELAAMEARVEAQREVADGLIGAIAAMKATIEDARAVADDLMPQLHAARETVAAAQARVAEWPLSKPRRRPISRRRRTTRRGRPNRQEAPDLRQAARGLLILLES